MNFLAEPGLGTNTVEIPQQQHPDQQFGIDGGPPGLAVKWCKLSAQWLEVEKPIHPAQKMIIGNVIVELEPIKQLSLIRQSSHHKRALRFNKSIESSG